MLHAKAYPSLMHMLGHCFKLDLRVEIELPAIVDSIYYLTEETCQRVHRTLLQAHGDENLVE